MLLEIVEPKASSSTAVAAKVVATVNALNEAVSKPHLQDDEASQFSALWHAHPIQSTEAANVMALARYDALWRLMANTAVNSINALSHPQASGGSSRCATVELDTLMTRQPLQLGAAYLGLVPPPPGALSLRTENFYVSNNPASKLRLSFSVVRTASSTASSKAPAVLFDAVFVESVQQHGSFPGLLRVAVGLAWDTCGVHALPMHIIGIDDLRRAQLSHMWRPASSLQVNIDWFAPKQVLVQSSTRHISNVSPLHTTPLAQSSVDKAIAMVGGEAELIGEWQVRISKIGNAATVHTYTFLVVSSVAQLEKQPQLLEQFWKLDALVRVSPVESTCAASATAAAISPLYCVC
jgi:hypothetical protein